MKVRRRYMNDVKGSTMQQKALAMAVYLKHRIDRRDSTLYNFSPNKIKTITGIAPKTLMRYLPTMLSCGYAAFTGKNREHLLIKRLSSHSDYGNIDISNFRFDSFSEVYNSLRAYIFLMLQARKDYVRRILQAVKNPPKGADYKEIRRKVKVLVNRGIIRNAQQEYREFGLSFKRIAKEIGICTRTAENVVNFAVKKAWVKKERHVSQFFFPKVNRYPVKGCTFSTRNNVYVVRANSYALSRSTAVGLCIGDI